MSHADQQRRQDGDLVSQTDSAVWNEGYLDLINERFADVFVLHDPAAPGAFKGPEGYWEYVSLYRSAIPDVEKTHEAVYATDDIVVLRWSARGTNDGEFMGIDPTHREVELTGINIGRVDDGRMAEYWEQYDALGLMRQLGIVPDPVAD